MKSPVTSITDEQLAEIEKEFGRNSPCPHHNREPIGFGHYHRCHDCGRDVPSEMLDKAQAASDRHDDLQVILRDAFARLRAAEADAKRYRKFRHNASVNRGMSHAEVDEEFDTAMQFVEEAMEQKA